MRNLKFLTHLSSCTLAVLLICGVLPGQLPLEQTIHEFGGGSGDQTGYDCANAGDVNADGFDDIIAGRPYDDSWIGTAAGSARVYCGRTGNLLHSFEGTAPGSRLGIAVGTAGDFNQDGHDDVVVGANSGGASLHGSVHVYSGLDGTVLLERLGPGGLGLAVGHAGDIDGDLIDDIVVGQRTLSLIGFAWKGGRVAVYGYDPASLAGKLILVVNGTNQDSDFGAAVDGLGDDANGDGVLDLVIGQPLYSPGGSAQPGRVYVISGADGSTIHVVDGPGSLSSIGASVSGGGDVDGDTVGDFAVGSHATDNARVYSGATGSLIWSFQPIGSDGGLGWDVCIVGDVDGDARADILVGIPLDDDNGTNAGEARLYSGQSGVICSIHGRKANDQFGYSVGGGGDVDGDGRPDLIIGAPFDEPMQAAIFANSGSVRVMTCAAPLATHDDFFWYSGWSVSRAGDVDADGYEDYIVGARNSIYSWGKIWIYSGRTHSSIGSFALGSISDEFGSSVSALGDLNGDGHDDYVVGAPGYWQERGRVRVCSGASNASFPYLDQVGSSPGDRFGHSVAGLGDVNGDGVPDFAVGAPKEEGLICSIGGGCSPTNTDAGRVRIISGADGSVIRTFTGSLFSQLGTSVSGIGDVDGDGLGDVVIGSPYHPGYGRVQIRSALNGTLIHSLAGYQSAHTVGFSVAGGGDVDGDGVPDAVVGAPYADSFWGNDVGHVYVISGADGTILQSRTGNEAGALLGHSVANAGDINGDGRADFMAGAPLADVKLDTNAGRVIAWSGADGSTLRMWEGTQDHYHLGRSVAGLGDLDGDCLDEMILGADGEYAGSFDGAALVVTLGGFRGTDAYGLGTPGCNGRIGLGVTSPPTLGNLTFGLRCRNAPPNAMGLTFMMPQSARITAGADLFGIGVLCHVDLLGSPTISSFNMSSDAQGHAAMAVPIPNAPVLAGISVSLQSFWNFGACQAQALGLGSSNGLEITVLP